MGERELQQRESLAVPAEDCRAQLDRIVGSAEFDTTERGRRFLRYVVEEALAGRAERIKAYTIAVEVLGRNASFDPQSDPIVRIEASQLRRALERYYLTAGVNDPILITIPKGGYVPTFVERPVSAVEPAPEPSAPVPGPAPRRIGRRGLLATLAVLVAVAAVAALSWSWLSPGSHARTPERPRLLVQSFEDLTGTETSAAIARGVSQEIVGQLSKFRDIIVVESIAAGPDGSVPIPRFTLGGSITLSDGVYRLRVRFINQADGSVIWANSYDSAMDVRQLLAAQSDIARRVATALAQSYGVISQSDAAIRMDNPPDDWAAYSCTLAFYAYRTEVDVARLPAVRDCLERAVARFPDYATAWGLLSQAYIDGMRFTYPFDPRTSPQTIERALDAARRAVELDPLNVRGLEAKMTALYFARDIEGALEAGKQAMEINPNDVELMKEYGSWLAQSGNWADGCRLTEEAVGRNPSRMAYSEAALALCAYFTGDTEKAAVLIRRSPAVNNPTYHAMAAAFFAEAGYMEDAARERDWLETHAPALIQNARREVSMRLLREQDVDRFLDSLSKAGLQLEG